MAAYLLLLVACLASLEVVSGQAPRRTVVQGTLIGKTTTFTENQFINITRDVDVFLGVAYAQPPTRFNRSQPLERGTDDIDATQFSSACLQPAPRWLASLVTNMSEDCLYLNVFAPNPKPSGASVMVWIHGGGFTYGTAMNYRYYGVPLVAKGEVIVVNINYRLGVFSQLTTKDDAAPGNLGLLDQVQALRWVYENIEAFGGDKERITIFGESAGSASVHFHMLSKLSRGYFSQGIMQSGSAFSSWAFRDDPERERGFVAELRTQMGCSETDSSAALVSCLRDKDALELMETANSLYDGTYRVTLDGNFLEDTPARLYERGDYARVPLVAGYDRDEGTLFMVFFYPQYTSLATPHIDQPAFQEIIRDVFDRYRLADENVLYEAISHEYTNWTTADYPNATYFQSVVDFLGDFEINCPVDYVVRAHAEFDVPVFTYYWTHAPSRPVFPLPQPWLGATHGEEIPFIFGHPFSEFLADVPGVTPYTDEEKAFSVDCIKLWSNFAKSGNTNEATLNNSPTPGGGQYSWPRYTLSEKWFQDLSPELELGQAVRAKQCHFWNQYLPSLTRFAGGLDEAEKEWKSQFNLWTNDMADWQTEFKKYKDGTRGN